MTTVNPSLEVSYHELEEVHRAATEAAIKYYQLKWAERNLLKGIKNKFRPNDNYRKWSHRARAIARKNMGRQKGKHRGCVDHIKPLLYCFLAGMTPEEASRKENLQIISKDANRKKSYIRL